jgi:hypothetical protein
LAARNLEFDPVALVEMMDTSIERQQKLKPMIGFALFHVMWGYVTTPDRRPLGRADGWGGPETNGMFSPDGAVNGASTGSDADIPIG